MTRLRLSPLLVMVSLCACSGSDEVIKAEFAEDIYVPGGVPPVSDALVGLEMQIAVGDRGMWISFADHEIIKITLNLDFEDDLNQLLGDVESGSDQHRRELYSLLSKNASFYNGGNEIEPIWGHWPEDVTETSASNMALFYVIPSDSDLNGLRFEYEPLLRGVDQPYTYAEFANLPPLEIKE